VSIAETAAKGPEWSAPHQSARRGDQHDAEQTLYASAQRHGDGEPRKRKAKDSEPEPTGSVTVTPTGGEITLDNHPAEVSDWDGILRFFGLNPDEFAIADDTIKMSKWQQAKGLDDGGRDVIWLYSYKARFVRQKRTASADVVAEHRKRVQKFKPLVRRTPGSGLGEPSTLWVGWADWQIGKDGTLGEGGTVERVLASFDATVKRLRDLRRLGRNVEGIAIANMGDPGEGCYGNYDSQLSTIELNQRQQMDMVLDLWSTGLWALLGEADQVLFLSVLCNHGEWTRQSTGGRPVTSDSDNAGGAYSDALQRIFDGREGTDHLRWNIAQSNMNVDDTLSGVDIAVTHGHKMPGSPKELEWLKSQSIRLLRENGREPRLWFTAHKHHVDIRDFGPWTRVQHPSMDNGSKWYTDHSGNWSTPGTLTMLVGKHDEAGDRFYSDMQVV
jgi:hypothetical protein